MMNFLIHLYVADINGDSLLGHFLGDFVKGRHLNKYDEILKSAIRFHRRIDSFSDSHPVITTCRQRFKPPWRRFAGVIVDVCYDHFLARHWKNYSLEPLRAFTHRVYAQLCVDNALLDATSRHVLERMIAHDWLGSYANLENVGFALDRIAGRLSRGEVFLGSISEIKAQYRELEEDFHCFFPDLLSFAGQYQHGSLPVVDNRPPAALRE